MRMRKRVVALILFMSMSVVSGCATVKPNRAVKVDPKVRVQQLEEELRQKDAEIDALKDQMAQSSYDYPSRPTSNYGSAAVSKGSASVNIIGPSLTGVSVKSIQKALKNAGYYTGSVDGQAGAKTKDAVKAFQKSKGLTADGIVGKTTWSVLSRYLN